ncbi:MAG TPA: nuclear transport factor 2 family protein [Humisphaera sp.]
MREPTPPPSSEIDAVRAAYDALNRGDVPGFVHMFDPRVERVELFSGRSYSGFAAVTEHVREGRATWAEGGCEPRRFLAAGDRVVALVDVRVRVQGETDWREGRVADVYTFRDGRAIEFRSFGDEREALAWAGLVPAGAGGTAD